MKWIGLTGGIGSGKSTVANLLREQGLSVVDADVLAREVVAPGSPGLNEIVTAFGPEILNEEGALDRKKMGALVFQDSEALSRLEAIIHPRVQEKMKARRRELENQGEALAFYDVPLLFEKRLQDRFDATLLVYAPRDSQIKRVQERDGLSLSDIEQRLKSQLDIETKREQADYIIDNSLGLTELKVAVDQFLKQVLN